MKVDTRLLDRVSSGPEFDAKLCLNCGTCTALCPLGLEILPRKIFHHVLLGDKERLLAEENAIFSCLLCRMCEVNCPGGVHIAENVRALRVYLNEEIHGLAEV